MAVRAADLGSSHVERNHNLFAGHPASTLGPKPPIPGGGQDHSCSPLGALGTACR
jgi:hypothetical protein